MYFLLSYAYLKYLAAVPSANLVDNGGDNYELRKHQYKSSTVADMGDRGNNRNGPKRGGLLCHFCWRESWAAI